MPGSVDRAPSWSTEVLQYVAVKRLQPVGPGIPDHSLGYPNPPTLACNTRYSHDKRQELLCWELMFTPDEFVLAGSIKAQGDTNCKHWLAGESLTST